DGDAGDQSMATGPTDLEIFGRSLADWPRFAVAHDGASVPIQSGWSPMADPSVSQLELYSQLGRERGSLQGLQYLTGLDRTPWRVVRPEGERQVLQPPLYLTGLGRTPWRVVRPGGERQVMPLYLTELGRAPSPVYRAGMPQSPWRARPLGRERQAKHRENVTGLGLGTRECMSARLGLPSSWMEN
ncbi:unnamed protein product, partial [Effrenium voratum]